MVSEQHRFVTFGQVEGRHGGTGFVVSKRLEPCLTQYKKLSDRVGYADFVIPSGGKSKNVIDVRFIVAYGPTTPSVQKDSNLLEKFYDTLSRAQLTKKAQDASVHCRRLQQQSRKWDRIVCSEILWRNAGWKWPGPCGLGMFTTTSAGKYLLQIFHETSDYVDWAYS